MLRNTKTINSIIQACQGNFLPRFNYKKVNKLIQGNCIIIDARLEDDYKEGHIPDAISVPIDSSDKYRRQALTGIELNKPILVYCQSRGCAFAEEIAVKLENDGFMNVSLYPGGWNDWNERNSSVFEETN